MDDSSLADFRVLLGLGDALVAGLELFDVVPLVALDFPFFPPCGTFVKLKV